MLITTCKTTWHHNQGYHNKKYKCEALLFTDSKYILSFSQESQKKFGSLRKLGRKTNEQNGSSTNQEISGTVAAASSLDRKYLPFLGSRSNRLPVPTSQFRSYRKVPNGPAPTPLNKAISDGQKQPNKAAGEGCVQRTGNLISSVQDPSVHPSNEACNVAPQQKVLKLTGIIPSSSGLLYQSAESVPTLNSTSEKECQTSHDIKPLLGNEDERHPSLTPVRGESMFKPLPLPMQRHFKTDFRDRHVHSSNPSLQLPSDMADYRLAAERLRELGIRRNRQREDTSGFVTLKEFMLSRQEEERKQNSKTTQRLQPAGNSEGVFRFLKEKARNNT